MAGARRGSIRPPATERREGAAPSPRLPRVAARDPTSSADCETSTASRSRTVTGCRAAMFRTTGIPGSCPDPRRTMRSRAARSRRPRLTSIGSTRRGRMDGTRKAGSRTTGTPPSTTVTPTDSGRQKTSRPSGFHKEHGSTDSAPNEARSWRPKVLRGLIVRCRRSRSMPHTTPMKWLDRFPRGSVPWHPGSINPVERPSIISARTRSTTCFEKATSAKPPASEESDEHPRSTD
jgi:hypothetical protein